MNLQSVTQKRGVVSIRLYMLQKGVEELLISIFYMYIKIDMPIARKNNPTLDCYLPVTSAVTKHIMSILWGYDIH